MKSKPLVSVILPTYNRAAVLEKSIESVLRQSLRELELIVVDDGSEDETQKLLASVRDPRLRTVRLETNGGACRARNIGSAVAGAPLLAFQDSDDLWRPDKLERQLAHLRDSGADMVFCRMRRISEKGKSFLFPVHSFDPERMQEELLMENRAATQTMLMKAEVWQALRFDESLRRYQDWDFAIRAAGQFRLAYLPETLAESFVQMDSISATVSSYPALSRLYEKHAALYAAFPGADAVMNRRMGKRLAVSDPAAAYRHFLRSYHLSRSAYDLSMLFLSVVRSRGKFRPEAES